MTKLAIGKSKLIVYLFLILWWIPSFCTNFYGDDWFHLRITQISSFGEFLHFFSFYRGINDSPVYRPFSIELYFFIMQKAFGLMPIFFHIFSLAIFGGILYYLQRITSLVTKNQLTQLVVVSLYGISTTHFMHFFYISMVQELLMTLFSVISIFYFFRGSKSSLFFSLITFVCALLSKENAVVVPFLIFIFNLCVLKRSDLRSLVPYFVILLLYSVVRFTALEIVSSDSYVWVFSPTKVLNTLMWYGLWSLGTPELLVDYISGGFRILPRFFSDLKSLAYPIIFGTIFSTFIFVLMFSRNFLKKGKMRVFIALMLFFLIGLGPYLFLPWHKFSLNLTLPIVGLSLLFGLIIEAEKNKVVRIMFVLTFVCFNLFSYFLSFKYSYALGRSEISFKIQDYFMKNYPKFPNQNKVFFYNPIEEDKKILPYASEVSVAISRSNIFKTIYHDKSIEVYFEDESFKPNQLNDNVILINAKEFVP